MKGRPADNCKTTLNIEFEQDWSFTLGAMLGDRQTIKKQHSSYKNFFPTKADSHIVGVRMYNKFTQFDENRWSHFCFSYVNYP